MVIADPQKTPVAPAFQPTSAGALLRSGELGRRLVQMANLAAAAHMAQTTEQIMRDAGVGARP